jgi:uncharacterized protein (TIGR03086 family)
VNTVAPQLHRRAADRFGQLVHAVQPEQWQLATPCAAWDVRALVNHVVGENRWVVPLFKGQTVSAVGDLLDGDLLGADPVAAWDESLGAAAAAIQRYGAMDRTIHLSFGDVAGHEYVTQLVADLVIHGWDLAHAIGQDETLDPQLVHACAQWFSGVAELCRQAGIVGPPQQVPDTADPQTKLLAAFGRSRD